jgi:hypothetical protein
VRNSSKVSVNPGRQHPDYLARYTREFPQDQPTRPDEVRSRSCATALRIGTLLQDFQGFFAIDQRDLACPDVVIVFYPAFRGCGSASR